MLNRIVSGGQTGVDRAALDTALELGLDAGGWCPRGRTAEDGTIDARYPLRETDETEPSARTRRNVDEADATLVLVHLPKESHRPAPGHALPPYLRGGTQIAAKQARRRSRPLYLADPREIAQIEGVAAWIARHGIRILNIAGPRESECPGIHGEAKSFLLALLTRRSS